MDTIYFEAGMAADDVLAHEFTHGISEAEIHLGPAGQAGAINESLSDVFGELFDLSYGSDDPADKWLIGEDGSRGALRDMADPPSFSYPVLVDGGEGEGEGEPEYEWYPYPDYYGGPGFQPDFDNPHVNATINDKLCYLLTDGDDFRGRTITGMGQDAVAALYYKTLDFFLTPWPDFGYFYSTLALAAYDLDWSIAERNNLENACRAVEIVPREAVVVKNSSGEALVEFTSLGDILLYGGTLATEQSITPSNSVSEFIVKNSSGDTLLLVDGQTGNVRISGRLYPNRTMSAGYYTDKMFRIRNSSGNTQIFVAPDQYYCTLLDLWNPWIPAGTMVITGSIISIP